MSNVHKRPKNMKTAPALAFALIVSGCAGHRALLPSTEFVLTEGMKITATTPNGTVVITAGEGTERTFSGEGWSKKRHLIPRSTRWYGSLGLYDPADSSTPHGRVLVDEGRQFFATESEALRYLDAISAYFKPVFSSTGLVVGYKVVPFAGGEPTRSVEVWQIYINGKKPHSLRGADDSAIRVSGGETPETSSPNPAPIGHPRKIGDREYVPKKAD
jgi:hypothetical protein